MLKEWARSKCLGALMGIMGAKEGEWIEMDGKEYMISDGEIYSRPLIMDVVSAGIMVSNADNRSSLRNTFKPRLDAVYYYWIVDAPTGKWKLQCAVYHDNVKDKQNVHLHNCFADATSAERYKTEWKKIF